MRESFPVEVQVRFEQAIVAGELSRGSTAQTAELAARFGATIEEMCQVLAAAERKGLARNLSSDAPRVEILGLSDTTFVSVFTHTDRSGLKPKSVVRAATVEPASVEAAEKLEVDVRSPVYRYVRTRYVEEEPLANQTNFMPYEICPGLEHDDVTRYSFQKLLEVKYHTVLAGANEAISLVPATEQDREVLGLPEGSSILLIDRIALSPSGRPVVWATIRIRPDRYPYVAALWPEAARLLQDR